MGTMLRDERQPTRHAAEVVAPARSVVTSTPLPRLTLLALGTVLTTIGAWIGVLAGEAAVGIHALCIAALFLLGTSLLLVAALHRSPWLPPQRPSAFSRLATGGVLAATVLSATLTLALALGFLATSFSTARIYDSDAAAFNQFNAELVLQGKNPYTADGLFWDAIHQFPTVGATPLRLGRYAQSAWGPSLHQLVRDVKAELANPALRGPEFPPASLHSYPSLAFLIYVPGLWLGLPTTLVTSMLFALGFLLASGWGASRGTRIWVVLTLAANTLLVFWTIRGSFEVVALLPALLAWRVLDRRWLSAILLGLACAVKQIVWPLSLFYAVIVWRRYGQREALRRTAIVAAAFAVPNLPFILASPGPWLKSLFLPMTLPIFPSGIGLVGLARWNLLPLWPSAAYTMLEFTALGGLLLWFARSKVMPRPAIALVVGLLPLFLAWHSAFSYLIAIPTCAVYASLDLLQADRAALAARANASTATPSLAAIPT